MKCKEKLEAYLRESGIAFQVQHHPLAYTAQAVAASEHIPGKTLAKVVMMFADENLVMLVMPAPHKVDVDRAELVLGVKKARLALEEEFAEKFPDCEVGAMPPFGNLYDLPVYVDEALSENETIVFQAGTHTDTMSMKFKDFDRLVRPSIVDLAKHVVVH